MKVPNRFRSKGQLQAHYHSLSKDELLRKRAYQFQVAVSSSIGWAAALILVMFVAGFDLALFLLFGGVISSLLLLTHSDYRQRVSLIDQILKTK